MMMPSVGMELATFRLLIQHSTTGPPGHVMKVTPGNAIGEGQAERL